MSQRHSRLHILRIAVLSSAVVSVGLATATTAQLIRNKKNVHRAAPEVMNMQAPEYEKNQRDGASAMEKGKRQEAHMKMKLRNLHLGN